MTFQFPPVDFFIWLPLKTIASMLNVLTWSVSICPRWTWFCSVTWKTTKTDWLIAWPYAEPIFLPWWCAYRIMKNNFDNWGMNQKWISQKPDLFKFKIIFIIKVNIFILLILTFWCYLISGFFYLFDQRNRINMHGTLLKKIKKLSITWDLYSLHHKLKG